MQSNRSIFAKNMLQDHFESEFEQRTARLMEMVELVRSSSKIEAAAEAAGTANKEVKDLEDKHDISRWEPLAVFDGAGGGSDQGQLGKKISG